MGNLQKYINIKFSKKTFTKKMENNYRNSQRIQLVTEHMYIISINEMTINSKKKRILH